MLLALGVCMGSPAQARVTAAFSADFHVHRGLLGLGRTHFRLQAADRPDCYIYSGDVDPNAVVRLFLGNVRDRSRFCLIDGKLRPQHYRHHVDDQPAKSYTLDFDWQQHEVIYENESGARKRIAFDRDVLDPMTLQIAARRWLAHARQPSAGDDVLFALVDEDEIKPYRLRVTGQTPIETDGGRFDTMIIEHGDGGDDRLRFWLARYADWIPVRVEQHKSGLGTFRMDLTRLQREKR